mmetsp:Transcript_18142/g.44513  ORF Transcript_18142/g.44513 Transcript_18142/m.44513 type:complete len:202 (-) Transcript_18142:516-1121(-)
MFEETGGFFWPRPCKQGVDKDEVEKSYLAVGAFMAFCIVNEKRIPERWFPGILLDYFMNRGETKDLRNIIENADVFEIKTDLFKTLLGNIRSEDPVKAEDINGLRLSYELEKKKFAENFLEYKESLREMSDFVLDHAVNFGGKSNLDKMKEGFCMNFAKRKHDGDLSLVTLLETQFSSRKDILCAIGVYDEGRENRETQLI